AISVPSRGRGPPELPLRARRRSATSTDGKGGSPAGAGAGVDRGSRLEQNRWLLFGWRTLRNELHRDEPQQLRLGDVRVIGDGGPMRGGVVLSTHHPARIDAVVLNYGGHHLEGRMRLVGVDRHPERDFAHAKPLRTGRESSSSQARQYRAESGR